ncbi:MAG: hypothetical protein ACOY0R_17755, partial [Chloroflexota bacterium]
SSRIWWDHLLYGAPPPGLDVRLSLELRLQRIADQRLGAHPGAAVLMNAHSGEMLVMASHPTFDPNRLEEEGESLLKHELSPLVNRAALGAYPLGTMGAPFLSALEGTGERQVEALYDGLGFFTPPQIRMEVAAASPGDVGALRVSPVQMAAAASVLSAHGMRPTPRIALAVNTPQQGWVVLPALGQPVEALPSASADQAAAAYLVEGQAFWEFISQARQGETIITWYIGGTLPNWLGTPLAVAIVLEEDNIPLARQTGRDLLIAALTP